MKYNCIVILSFFSLTLFAHNKEDAYLVDTGTNCYINENAFTNGNLDSGDFSCSNGDVFEYSEDVWLKFVARASSYNIWANRNLSNSFGYQIIDLGGNEVICDRGALSAQSNPESAVIETVSGLKIGETYYVHAAKDWLGTAYFRHCLTPINLDTTELDTSSMQYLSNLITHEGPNIADVGDTNVIVLRVEIIMHGRKNPQTLSSFTFSTDGTTSPSTDISKAKVFYTGSNDNFGDFTQFGSTVVNPKGIFTVNGSQQLISGKNYFWLVFSTTDSVKHGNVVDAKLNEFVTNKISETLYNNNSPSGNVEIVRMINMPIGNFSDTLCGARFFDDGGLGDDYSGKSSAISTFYPSTPNSLLKADFVSFKTKDSNDVLNIYNGNNTSAPLIRSCSGTSAPSSITSTAADGSLTFEFSSTNVFGDNGWDLDIYCTPRTYMTYKRCDVTQIEGYVQAGKVDIPILRVNIVTEGLLDSLEISSLTFNTYGTTDANDIKNIKLYYTGSRNEFAPTSQYGKTIKGALGEFSMSESLTLIPGENFFWLTYDVDTNAQDSNLIDAELTAIEVDGEIGIPSVSAPAGSRTILHPDSLVTLPWTETFEKVGPNKIFSENTEIINGIERWEYQKTVDGRLRFQAGDGFYHSGSHAATMDADGMFCENYLILNLGLSKYDTSTDLALSFYYMQHSDDFELVTMSIRGDSAANWVEIFDVFSHTSIPGEWNYIQNLDIDSVLAASGQKVSFTFQLMIEQIGLASAYSPSDSGGVTFDDITIGLEGVLSMEYVSSTATQDHTSVLTREAADEVILGLEIVVSNNYDPLVVDGLTFSTVGSTDPINDINNAKVYYTSTSSAFATDNQFGSTVTSPNGNFIVNGAQQLVAGTNYFWLAYDIANGATEGNVVDAQCTKIGINTLDYIPTVTNPTGNRKIDIDTDIDIIKAHNITLSPNPASEYLQIIGLSNNNFVYQFVDVSGIVCKEGELEDNSVIHISDLSEGLYILTIKGNEKQFIKKVVIR